jgi:hypothetical protein
MSTNDVSSTTGIPRGTLWLYLRDIRIPRKPSSWKNSFPRDRLVLATKERHAKQRVTWNLEMDETSKKVPEVTGVAAFFLGLGLYWGEGAKNERRAISFSNSDPRAIRAFVSFIDEIGADKRKLSAGLVIHKDIDPDKAREFWSKVSGILPERIYISQIDGHKNPNKRSRGVLSPTLQDAAFSRKIFGWLRGVYGQFADIGEDNRPFSGHDMI